MDENVEKERSREQTLGITQRDVEQSEWYKTLYDLSPTLCMVMDPDGTVIDCNMAFVKALGYLAKGEITGRSFPESIDPSGKAPLAQIFEIWRRTGRIHNHEFRMKRADGTTFPALLNATSVHDELGRTIACNASILNITELVNARKKIEITMQDLLLKEAKLREVNEELRRVERAKEEFLSLVSHELKNPLTPVIGFSDMLRKHTTKSRQLTDAHIEGIKIINNSANEMRRLIEDILAVYKLDMRLEFVFTENRILDLIDQVTNEMTSILQEKEITVERMYRLDNGHDGTITCDAMRVRQVLVNLIRNSIDFVPNSGGKIKVTVESIGQGGTRMIEVSVADNGPGIPADKRSGLFRKFYQAYSNTTRRHGGTGLGLTICKEIIEMHGGKIWYDTEFANGACFRFDLPAMPVATSKGSAA